MSAALKLTDTDLAKLVQLAADVTDPRPVFAEIDRLAADPAYDPMAAALQAYVTSLDERRRTILSLRERGKSPSEIALMMNEDPKVIRAEVGRMFVDMRLLTFPV